MAVEVEPAPSNGRCLFAGVDITAPPHVVWQALTDYDALDSFIPGARPAQPCGWRSGLWGHRAAGRGVAGADRLRRPAQASRLGRPVCKPWCHRFPVGWERDCSVPALSQDCRATLVRHRLWCARACC